MPQNYPRRAKDRGGKPKNRALEENPNPTNGAHKDKEGRRRYKKRQYRPVKPRNGRLDTEFTKVKATEFYNARSPPWTPSPAVDPTGSARREVQHRPKGARQVRHTHDSVKCRCTPLRAPRTAVEAVSQEHKRGVSGL